eukprot:c7814_g1_i1.p1 GENE.c7814_g1_i1~~c7814_g1_i1.p1  ORF type:complete len:818 (-),score=193.80 c7814_g1_i1:51-2504(-)
MGVFDFYVRNLIRFKYGVLVFWFGIVILGLFFAPKFMSGTSTTFAAPDGSKAHKAAVALNEAFPGTSEQSPIIVLFENKDGLSVLNNVSRDFSAEFMKQITAFNSSALVGQLQGYWYLKDQYATVAQSYLSQKLESMTIIAVLDGANTDERDKLRDHIVDVTHTLRKNLPEGYWASLTGEYLFYKDITEGIDADLTRVDGISMPIALAVLSYVLYSTRLVIMPLLSIILSVVLSFSMMYPISKQIDVASTTPSLMISCVVALSTDYSLFMFSRFGEEIKENADAIACIKTALATAGHTILISGSTLCVCFLGLAMLPLTFLQTMGLGAGCAVFACVFVSLNFVPALVFCFPKFFANAFQNDFFTLFRWIRSRCFGRPNAPRAIVLSTFSPVRSETLKRSRWYRLANWTVKYRIPITIVLLLLLIPSIYLSLTIETSTDITLNVPRNAESVHTYHRMSHQFAPGQISPYTLLFLPKHHTTVLNPLFFNQTHQVITAVAAVEGCNIWGLNGLTVFNGSLVYFDQWFEAVSKPFNLTNEFERTLQTFTVEFTNIQGRDMSTATAMKVLVTLSDSPYSVKGADWLKKSRKAIDELKLDIEVHIANGAGDQIDGIDLVYEFLPVEMGVTAAIVYVLMAISFRSLVVPLRSLVSLTLTISVTYAFAVLVYNHGMFKWLGWYAIDKYDGISWFTPVMCFSILTGFGLDYDCFILTRIVEFRESGFTEHASIKLAVYKTGSIITAAGTIMSIAFAGLLLSEMPLLNMCSFFIVFSVLFDTFVVRSLLVPATMAILNRFNFFPRKLVPESRDEDQEPQLTSALLNS